MHENRSRAARRRPRSEYLDRTQSNLQLDCAYRCSCLRATLAQPVRRLRKEPEHSAASSTSSAFTNPGTSLALASVKLPPAARGHRDNAPPSVVRSGSVGSNLDKRDRRLELLRAPPFDLDTPRSPASNPASGPVTRRQCKRAAEDGFHRRSCKEHDAVAPRCSSSGDSFCYRRAVRRRLLGQS